MKFTDKLKNERKNEQKYSMVKVKYTPEEDPKSYKRPKNQIIFYAVPTQKLEQFQNNSSLFLRSLDAKSVYSVNESASKGNKAHYNKKAADMFHQYIDSLKPGVHR